MHNTALQTPTSSCHSSACVCVNQNMWAVWGLYHQVGYVQNTSIANYGMLHVLLVTLTQLSGRGLWVHQSSGHSRNPLLLWSETTHYPWGHEESSRLRHSWVWGTPQTQTFRIWAIGQRTVNPSVKELACMHALVNETIPHTTDAEQYW